MAKISCENIRNVCLLGHGGSGKTTMAEAMLYMNKATDRMGNTSAGNTVCDFDPEEIKRGFSVSAACANYIYRDTKINVIDAPGFLEFSGEVHGALRVAGCAVIMVDAKSGIQVGTELAWENAPAAGLPKAFFINKSDDPEANFEKVFASLRETFGKSVCPIVIPSATAGAFINLIDEKKYEYGARGERTTCEITPEYLDKYLSALDGMDLF